MKPPVVLSELLAVARRWHLVLALLALLVLVPAARAHEGHCIDPNGTCTEPCEADNPLHCHSEADCDPGMECSDAWSDPNADLPCIPPWCHCNNGVWNCADMCTDLCLAVEVPALTGGAPLVLGLLLVTGLILFWPWRRRSAR